MRRVFFSATAMDADRFTEVVVFPTPPFWLATLIIRPMKVFLQSDYLTHPAHKFQEKSARSRNKNVLVPRGTFDLILFQAYEISFVAEVWKLDRLNKIQPQPHASQ